MKTFGDLPIVFALLAILCCLYAILGPLERIAIALESMVG